MNSVIMSKSETVWYREPWVWLLIALPASAVIAGMFTLYLAITSNHDMVVDDYYKKGKEINLVLARDKQAAMLGLNAHIDIDRTRDVVSLVLKAGKEIEFPDELTLLFLHPTKSDQDRSISITHSGAGQYSGPLSDFPAGRWYIQLESQTWRLTGSAQITAESAQAGHRIYLDSGLE